MGRVAKHKRKKNVLSVNIDSGGVVGRARPCVANRTANQLRDNRAPTNEQDSSLPRSLRLMLAAQKRLEDNKNCWCPSVHSTTLTHPCNVTHSCAVPVRVCRHTHTCPLTVCSLTLVC
jgi:hypothetical protein